MRKTTTARVEPSSNSVRTCCSLQENIKHIQEHILDIQKREIEKMNAYAQSLNPSADPKKEDSEVPASLPLRWSFMA